MKRYKIEKMRHSPFHYLRERRRVKGKWEWVCIGILTGVKNSERVEEKLNG